MKDKTKGFTLIELILTLAITVIVLGVIYTFSFTSQKILSSTDLNSVLQDEGRNIENSLVDIGMQAKGIKTIDTSLTTPLDKNYSSLPATNKLEINEISMIGQDDAIYSFIKNGTVLSLIKDNDISKAKVLSKNVYKIEIRPLDINTVTDKDTSFFANAPGLEISISLYKKEGFNEITYPVSTIVKFRNKDVI